MLQVGTAQINTKVLSLDTDIASVMRVDIRITLAMHLSQRIVDTSIGDTGKRLENGTSKDMLLYVYFTLHNYDP